MENREDMRTGENCPICQAEMIRDPENEADICPHCGHEESWNE